MHTLCCLNLLRQLLVGYDPAPSPPRPTASTTLYTKQLESGLTHLDATGLTGVQSCSSRRPPMKSMALSWALSRAGSDARLQISSAVIVFGSWVALEMEPSIVARTLGWIPENGQCPREGTLLVHFELCCAGDGARTALETQLMLSSVSRSSGLSSCLPGQLALTATVCPLAPQ